MEIDFDHQDQVSDFVTVPEGTYLCRVAEVRKGSTRAGDERWSLRLVVAEGQHVGKQAAWDGLVFSTRGRSRARMVLHALGLPSRGKVHIEPTDLEGRCALVEVRPSEYESPAGSVVRRNEVPYDGYRQAEGSGDVDASDGDASDGDASDGDRPPTARGDISLGEVPF